MDDFEFYWGANRMYDSYKMCAADYNGLELNYFAEDFIGAHRNTKLDTYSPFKLY